MKDVILKLAGILTVKGGTGWGAEFSKLCNKPVHVYDQEQHAWFKWSKERWKYEEKPKIKTSLHPLQDGAGISLTYSFN